MCGFFWRQFLSKGGFWFFFLKPLRFEAIALHFEAIVLRFNVIALNFEAIALNFEATALHFEATALHFEAIVLNFEAIALNFEAIALHFEAIVLHFEAIVLQFKAVVLLIRTPIKQSEWCLELPDVYSIILLIRCAASIRGELLFFQQSTASAWRTLLFGSRIYSRKCHILKLGEPHYVAQ